MGDIGMNKAKKVVGRNMARANNQKKGGSVPMKFANGGGVMAPQNRTNPESLKITKTGPAGAGTPRGTGAAVKGKHFGGTY